MKKLLFIATLLLSWLPFASTSAQVAKIGSTEYATLQAAFNAAEDGDEILLLADVDATSTMYSGDSRYNLWIKSGITLDGANHTVTVKGRGIGVQGKFDKIDVTFKDITVKNVGNVDGRCVDTRGSIASLTLNGVTLTTGESLYSGYLQPLTIGGNQGTTTTVTITNSNIITVDNAKKGYAITTFNPVNLSIDGSTLKGWACLNLKGPDSSAGSNGSSITVTNSTLVSANGTPGDTNAYSLIKIEDDNVNVDITGSTINVNGDDNAQSIVSFQKFDLTNSENCSVSLGVNNNVTLEGDYRFASNVGDTSSLAISGGTFNVPVPEEFCAEGYIPTDLGNGKYGVKVGTYVAQIGTTKYETLQAAVTAAQDGATIQVIKAGEYAIPAITKNLTIEATVNGVVVNHTDNAAITTIASGQTATFKNITFDLGTLQLPTAHGFGTLSGSNGSLVMNGCTINGALNLFGESTFTNCKFNAEGIYNIWAVNDKATFTGCTFTNTNRAVNVYDQKKSGTTKNVSFSNCTFAGSAKKKAAVNIHHNPDGTAAKYAVSIKDCTTSGTWASTVEETGELDGSTICYSPLWMISDIVNWEDGDITVTVDGEAQDVSKFSPVAKIGDTKYTSIAAAVAAAENGATIKVIKAGEYTLPNLPANVTIEGAAEGDVVFNHTTAGNVASVPNGATFRNVTFNFGNVNYHGFQDHSTINMEDCTLNGKFFSYWSMNFTNCQFNQTNADYHMWVYGGSTTENVNVNYTNCTFTNTADGKFLNLYSESSGNRATVTVTDCKFVNNASAATKAALNVKATCGSTLLAYDVIINNCTTEGAFPAASSSDALVVLNNLAQVDDRTASGVDNITVTIDDVRVYPAAIAQIGETTYPSLKAAVAAAQDGDVITMIADDNVSLTTAGSEITINKPLTITGAVDEDGKPLYTIYGSSNGALNGSSFNDLFLSCATGTVAVSNVNFDGFGNEISSVIGHSPVFIGTSNQNAVIENVYISNLNCEGIHINGGTFSIKNCNIDCSKTATSIFTKGICVVNAAQGSIENTTITGVDCDNADDTSAAIELQGSGNVTINGCTIQSNTIGIATTPVQDLTPGTSQVSISNCTVESQNIAVYSNGEKGALTSISSGYYSGLLMAGDNDEGLSISGGLFDDMPEPAYCAEGFAPAENTDAATQEAYPYTVVELPDVAQIGETKYKSLQAAVDAAYATMTGDVTIELIDNIDEYAIVKQKADLNLTIDGKEKTMSGNIVVNGMGRHTGTETLTIQDIKFVGDKANLCSGTSSFVEVPSLKTSGTPYYTNGNNYAHNITIKDCSFTSTEVVESERSIRAFGSASKGGSCYNITINNVTGSNLHSLAQFVGATGGIVTNCTIENGESFVNVSGGTGNFTISDNTFTSAEGADGYGIRENGTSTAVLNLTNNTFKAASAIVMGKKTDVTAGTINVISGTYVGDITKTDAATGQIVISGGQFSADLTDATYEPFIAEGMIGIQNNAVEGAPYSVEEGTYVAQVTLGESTHKYGSLEAAFAAAADGSTVTLLTNVELTNRLFVNAGATPAYASNNRYATTTENKSITLDLSGYNVTTGSNIALAGGSLNIVNNGTANATISTSGSGLAPVEVRGTGDLTSKRTLTIGENVTIKGGEYGLNIFGSNDAQKNIIDVNVNGKVEGILFVLGNLTNEENEIVITINGTVDASGIEVGDEECKTGIALNGNAKVIVNEGASVKGETGIEVRAGELTVNGGTITATATEYSYTANNSGTTIKGAAIAVASYDAAKDLKVTVSDGTLSGGKLIAVVDVQNNMDKVTVTAKDKFVDGADETVIPADYKWVSENGMSTLAPCVYVAQIGDVKYESLAEAVAAVPTDGTETTITMIDNEMINVVGYAITIPATKNVVLDLNGFQVVGTVEQEGTSALIRNLGTLTIKDSSDTDKDGTGTGKLMSGATPTWTWDGTDDYSGSYASNLIRNEKNLIVESGNLYNMSTGSAAYAIDNYSAGNVTINGGKVDAAKASAIRMFYVNGGSVTVNGGIVGHYTSDEDCTYMGIQVMSGTNVDVTVTGGTIAGNYALYANNTGGNIAISGGTFDGYVGLAASVPNISITDGAFNSWVGTWGDQTGFISGGIYAQPVDEVYCAEGYIPAANTDPETMEAYPYMVKKGQFVAQIGDNKYETLEEAWAAVEDGQTITLLADCAGNGIFAQPNTFSQGVTIDFDGHKYTVDGTTVGSTGTQTQAFHLEKDNKITLKNGTIYSEKARMLVQNYSDLTLDNMTLDGSKLVGNNTYTLSNNCGNVVIDNSTIIAKEGDENFAFDVCRYASYPSVNVTVTDGSEINGNIEVYASGSDAKDGFSLMLESGTFTGEIVLDATAKAAMKATPEKASITKADTFEAAAPEGYQWVSNGDGTSTLQELPDVAKIGDVKYKSLEAAFAAVQDGETITLLDNCEGNGIKAPEGKFTNGIIVDFGGFTYSVTGTLVGSTGTETQGFQLLKDNKITFKNGTITSDKALFLVQNYSDLTLEGMTLTLNNENYTSAYTLSNNNGTVVIDGSTINANEAGGFAFDVCRYSTYPSVSVTVKGASVINGDIEVSASGSDAKDGFSLMLESGTFTGDIVLDPSAEAAMSATPDKASVTKKDNVNIDAPANYMWISNNNGTSTLGLISEAEIVLIDGQPYTYKNTVDVKKVTYKRNMNGIAVNNWAAWYVPFDYTITAQDLNNIKFYKINLIANAPKPGENTNSDLVYVYLTEMSEDETLYANRPYVFKCSQSGELSFTTTSTTLYAPVDGPRLENSTSFYTYEFFGTTERTYFTESNYYFIGTKDGKVGITWADGNRPSIPSYRWYIKATPKDNGNYAPVFVFTEDDDDATGINLEDNEVTEESYYNMSGMKINKPARGTYIIKYSDGSVKKVAVK